MALTNPGREAYEEYATEELVDYLKNNACTEVTEQFGFLERYCSSLVDSGRPQIQQLIAQTTARQNFVFFSLYQTNLAIASPLPSYQVEAVGVFQKFFIYEVERL